MKAGLIDRNFFRFISPAPGRTKLPLRQPSEFLESGLLAGGIQRDKVVYRWIGISDFNDAVRKAHLLWFERSGGPRPGIKLTEIMR